jgi:mannonate dehydratase
MTFDCGVSREMGEDPVAVAKWLSERDCINHVHFRNVRVRKPYVDLHEVWLDEGVVNMFAVMKDWCARNQYPGGGGFAAEIYNVGYAKAMLQAALSS